MNRITLTPLFLERGGSPTAPRLDRNTAYHRLGSRGDTRPPGSHTASANTTDRTHFSIKHYALSQSLVIETWGFVYYAYHFTTIRQYLPRRVSATAQEHHNAITISITFEYR